MKKVYLEECSSLFMEAEKFHNLLSTWCKARKASNRILSQSVGLWIRGSDGVNPSWGEVENEEKCSIWNNEIGKRGRSFPFSAFCSVWTFNRLEDAHPHWGRPSILLSHQFKCSSYPEIPSQLQPEIMIYLDVPWPASWHIKLAITVHRATSWTAV